MSNKLSLSQGVAYSMPEALVNFLVVPTTMVLSGIYAKYFGLELTTIAAIMLVARLFDGITDPIIGVLSDRYRYRSETRKPWIVFGCLSLLICSYFLYVPPIGVSATYFLVWFMAFYLAWTVVEIPHLAWGSEVATSLQERNKLFSLRVIFFYAGAIVFYVLPPTSIF